MLSIKDVHSGYGAVKVLHGVDLEVERGSIATVIGANGAGKTTLLMTICGRPRASDGAIVFDSADITHLPMHQMVRRGIAHVPEGRRIFSRMSVLENLQLGAYATPREHFSADLDFVFALFPLLKERERQLGGTLSGGEQQMLAIGRALMSRPKLLLLDEPSLGLAPLIVRQMFETLRAINAERGTTILLIEQNAFQALKLAHRAFVMVNGRIEREGSGLDLIADPAVQAAYLDGGVGADAKREAAP